eukprot:Sdes_comp10309_c0_seq1m1948
MKDFEIPSSLDHLIELLTEALAGNEADVDHIQNLMQAYKSDPKEWIKYAHLDPYKYTRNLVSCGNGKFNLMLLAWNCGHASSIHDHAGSHCFMKVLGGKVEEELFSVPDQQAEMVCTRHTVLNLDKVAYIHDKIGLHRISNPDYSNPAFTLHLYSPPYEECRRFDERTGAASVTPKITFYSKMGQKVAVQPDQVISV